MKKSFKVFMCFAILSLLLVYCTEDDVTDPGNVDDQSDLEATILALDGLNLLSAVLIGLEDIDPDLIETPEDVISISELTLIKEKFTDALDLSPENPFAHLGMALIDVIEINFDLELWQMISDFDAEFGEGRALKNQLKFAAESPRLYLTYMSKVLEDPTISFARIQTFIDNNVIPKLYSAITHLGFTMALPDSLGLSISDGVETLEVDKGELYIFRSSIYALIAGMKILTLYDMDMYDAAGTYDWLQYVEGEDDYYYGASYYDTQEINGAKWLFIYHDEYEEVVGDSLTFSVLKHNLVNRASFLTFRTGATPGAIKTNLESALTDIINAVTYISAETDDQSDDVIKISQITDLNAEIAAGDPDAPEFMQNWTSINDVIAWLNTLMNGPYTFTDGAMSIDIDISKLFNPGISDMKALLPYHSWRDESEWVTSDSSVQFWENGGYDYWVYLEDTTIVVDSVDFVQYVDYYYDVMPVFLLDGPGGNPIMEQDFPYFPDYTMGGLFPGMTREKLLLLFIGR